MSSILLHCTHHQTSRVGVTREEGEVRSRRRSSSWFEWSETVVWTVGTSVYRETERPVHRDARSSLIVVATNVALWKRHPSMFYVFNFFCNCSLFSISYVSNDCPYFIKWEDDEDVHKIFVHNFRRLSRPSRSDYHYMLDRLATRWTRFSLQSFLIWWSWFLILFFSLFFAESTEWYVTVAATTGSKLSFVEQHFRVSPVCFPILIKIILCQLVSFVVFFISLSFLFFLCFYP